MLSADCFTGQLDNSLVGYLSWGNKCDVINFIIYYLFIICSGLLENNKMCNGYYNNLREFIPHIISNKISDNTLLFNTYS